MLDVEALHGVVKARLTKKRYHHSVCVQKQSVALAKRYGVDWYRAGVAGLLHDICKSDSSEDLLKYLRGSAILVDALTLQHPALWHAMAGSLFLRQELGIEDEEILNAVRYHTTGRAEMSDLEKVVYLADVTSQDRDFPDVEHTRRQVEQSLDRGMAYVLAHQVGVLAGAEKVIVRDTWEAYNYYLMRSNGQTARGG